MSRRLGNAGWSKGSRRRLAGVQRDVDEAAKHSLADVGEEHQRHGTGGILRSGTAVTDLYRRIFAGDLRLSVTFVDAATYWWPSAVVFAGREVGQYHDRDGAKVPLTIRTTRVFGYQHDARRWLQVHHHGSIDQPEQLAEYQRAVRG